RHLEDARAETDPGGLPGEPAEDGGGVRAVGLGGPHRVIAKPLGLLDDDVLVSFQGRGIRCRYGSRVLGFAGHRSRAKGARGGHSLCERTAANAPTPSSSCALRSTACRWRREERRSEEHTSELQSQV